MMYCFQVLLSIGRFRYIARVKYRGAYKASALRAGKRAPPMPIQSSRPSASALRGIIPKLAYFQLVPYSTVWDACFHGVDSLVSCSSDGTVQAGPYTRPLLSPPLAVSDTQHIP